MTETFLLCEQCFNILSQCLFTVLKKKIVQLTHNDSGWLTTLKIHSIKFLTLSQLHDRLCICLGFLGLFDRTIPSEPSGKYQVGSQTYLLGWGLIFYREGATIEKALFLHFAPSFPNWVDVTGKRQSFKSCFLCQSNQGLKQQVECIVYAIIIILLTESWQVLSFLSLPMWAVVSLIFLSWLCLLDQMFQPVGCTS